MTSPNDELFDRFEALTFDDVVVVPGYSETLPDSVDTAATFAADITRSVPRVSAAVDKVTESRMAITDSSRAAATLSRTCSSTPSATTTRRQMPGSESSLASAV